MNSTTTKWWVSSTGEGLSLTIKGALIAIVPTIMMICRLLDVAIDQSDVLLLIDLLTRLIAGAIIAVGIIRKIIFAIKARL